MKEANFLYWASLSEWPRWKAACLLSGVEPVSEDEFASRIRSEPEWLPARFYEAIKDANADGGLPYRSVGGKKMYTRVPSRQCVAWAIRLPWLKQYNHTIPAPLLEMLLTPADSTQPPPKPITTLEGKNAPALLPGSFEFEKPNWEQWRRIDETMLWKAACLAADMEPPKRKYHQILDEGQLVSFPREFHNVWEAVNCDSELSRLEYQPGSGRMLWKVNLSGFANWAIEKGFQVPQELRSIASRVKSIEDESGVQQAPQPSPAISAEEWDTLVEDEETARKDPRYRLVYDHTMRLYNERDQLLEHVRQGTPVESDVKQRLSEISKEIAEFDAASGTSADLPSCEAQIAPGLAPLIPERNDERGSPTPMSMAVKRLSPNGGDSLTPMIWEICYNLLDAGRKVTAKPVMAELKIRAEKRMHPLVGSVLGGVAYEYDKGEETELDAEKLRGRIKEWRKKTGN